MDTITEYRVRPVTRYIVTRHERPADPRVGCSNNGSRQIGSEYDNGETAYAVGYALAREEAQRLGYAPDDPRLIYPQDPKLQGAINQIQAGFGTIGSGLDAYSNQSRNTLSATRLNQSGI